MQCHFRITNFPFKCVWRDYHFFLSTMESQEKQPLVDFFTIVGIDKQKGLELFKYEAQKIEGVSNATVQQEHF